MPVPRIITVDPTWTLARVVRSALDLLDRPVIQVDVPGATEAYAELSRGCTLLITNYEVDDTTRGFELALRVKRESQDTSIIVLGDVGDPEEFDQETATESPYAYLCRPVDIQKFLRVVMAGLDGTSLVEAMFPTAMAAPVLNNELGPIPYIDVNAAQGIVDTLRVDLGAMAIIMSTRTGDVLMERGAVGLLNRDKLTNALLPGVLTTIEARDMLGGQLTGIQFYDGDNYDVFVLTVGLHHFLCAIFDGQSGSRQFGAVNRFGRRAVEDLIALIGASAFFIQPRAQPTEEKAQAARKKIQKQRETEEMELVTLERAEIGGGMGQEVAPVIEDPKLDPIVDLDLDKLFGGGDASMDDDLFNLDDMEQIASQNMQNSKGKLDMDTARAIGLLKE
ncbi:MAG TPA: hypothetical protein VHL11_18280 [Phototrophicaceae bacterium]|nr:hypothetical protein [Phototrophicaceae bacterium]